MTDDTTFRQGHKAGKTALLRVLTAHCPRCWRSNLTAPRPALKDGQPVPGLQVRTCPHCDARLWIAGPS